MEGKSTLLVVDDDPGTLLILGRILEHDGYRVLKAKSGRMALAILAADEVNLVLSDLVMPGMDGLALTQKIKRTHPVVGVMIITAYASIETAVQAIHAGASDYITKPVIPGELLLKVRKVLDEYRLKRELGDLRSILSKSRDAPEIIGLSPGMRRLFQLVNLLAKRDVPVVISGESGTGKELVAKQIHSLSARASKPFVPVNCSALPETLLESELFGYTKGAFTGASANKRGLFEEADGGTLFLDEIGDAPLSIQIRFLRVLQDGCIRRLGSTKMIPTDVRILVATNKDLLKEIEKGRFREDLYYRLNVVTVNIPSLRERKGDVPLLIDHFIRTHRESINPTVKGITSEAVKELSSYDWPGNVRELENTIRRALVLCRSELIGPRDILRVGERPDKSDKNGKLGPLKNALAGFHRNYFLQALDRRMGNVKEVAKDAGISRKNVYEHLKRLDIDPSEFRRKH